jgi:hypothetical protein
MASGYDLPEAMADECREREERLLSFPYSVMLELAYTELDFANRWCWQHLGPENGECLQKGSEYRVCTEEMPHCHTGKWTTYWFGKTEYDFGFNEWYFIEQSDRDQFLAILPEINWGEHYPK